MNVHVICALHLGKHRTCMQPTGTTHSLLACYLCQRRSRDCFRRQRLLIQSKVWITPETLDARIDEALENPIVLYGTASETDYDSSEDL